MQYQYIVFITSLLYCFINAALCAQLFPLYTRMPRKKYYFFQFFGFSAFAILAILTAQIIFFIYYCRIQILFYKLFGVFSPHCPVIPINLFITHQFPELLFLFYIATSIILYLIIKEKYTITSSDKLKLMIAGSNAIACAAKYIIGAALLG
jgi:hypothetical protein